MNFYSKRIESSAPVRVSCALLALWIFILSLAGVSPALHSWLHANTTGCSQGCVAHTEDTPPAQNDADGHYCGVIALQSALATGIVLALPERSEYERIHFQSLSLQLPSQTSELRHQARAPPIEILV